ncbi:epoxyqueuosine reductase [Thermodesulforhabdus norvegica]|uniref:Epoxyqueuosine reductase QueG (Queuosine biosynthesis) n=1 Tax=Thermodesulforhabdus norvegica TaxID=39841 RepID=A0A1I4R802_9BACT|nr:epoxyqueuosine reductase [Thermodesulforhabdus norvegica]SFM48377.1 Epoxyqueuosine reductase QueG (queuosine biosynthesis) [Thermodesulforhabdus norvegica]
MKVTLLSIKDRVLGSIEAWLLERGYSSLWREPLVGAVDARDARLLELKKAVAPDHALPPDLLPSARSVVVYFLPFVEDVAKDNGKFHPFASRLWAFAYVETNALIARINQDLASFLGDQGYETAVTPATHNFDSRRLVSRWSHKHLAYYAGLGTFGLNHLLITASGCCGRFGSLVTSAPVETSAKPQEEFCLSKRGLPCEACLKRCPVGALSVNGLNRSLCYQRLLENNERFSDLPLTDVCGQCSCNVPCSFSIPRN